MTSFSFDFLFYIIYINVVPASYIVKKGDRKDIFMRHHDRKFVIEVKYTVSQCNIMRNGRSAKKKNNKKMPVSISREI